MLRKIRFVLPMKYILFLLVFLVMMSCDCKEDMLIYASKTNWQLVHRNNSNSYQLAICYYTSTPITHDALRSYFNLMSPFFSLQLLHLSNFNLQLKIQ